MSKAVVRSRPIVLKKRTCRGCGTTLRPPRWLCSRCELADASVSSRRLADTDVQVQALRRNTGKACVSIASSLDTLTPASVPPEMRARWLRALRQTTRAVVLVEERLATAPGDAR
jgi:hypothetical protein